MSSETALNQWSCGNHHYHQPKRHQRCYLSVSIAPQIRLRWFLILIVYFAVETRHINSNLLIFQLYLSEGKLNTFIDFL